MPNVYGFQPAGQQPTPDARAVGAQLMQAGQQRGGQRQAMQEPAIDPEAVDAEYPARSRAMALHREGAKLSAGAGSEQDSFTAHAVGDALTRAGNAHQPNPDPYKDRESRVAHLRRFMSPIEAELLREVL